MSERFTQQERQLMSAECRKKGFEVTPDQYETEFQAVLESIQAGMLRKGYDLTEQDVFDLLQAVNREERRKAAFDKRIADLIESLPKENKPWCVVDGVGTVVKRYANKGDAVDDVIDRNLRAAEYGVTQRYGWEDKG